MLDQLKKDKLKLECSKEFLDFKKENPKAYFSAAFTIYENIKDAKWQIDYYNPLDDKITSFEVNEEIKVYPPSKVFQKTKEKIKEFNLDEVKINFEEALDILNKIRDAKYKDEIESKVIVILQNIKNKQVWNITYLTNNFNILNIKIDSSNGNILEEKLESLMKFKAK